MASLKKGAGFKISNIDIVVQILEPDTSYLRPLLIERFGRYAGGCSLCREGCTLLVKQSGPSK